MTSDEHERQVIIEAIARLLAGKPSRSSGALDIVTLAKEAGLKRNKLTHKHADLKDLFYAERKAREGIPDSETTLRDEITNLKDAIKNLRAERDQYRIASETFARAVHVLTVENADLRKDIGTSPISTITPRPARH